MKEIPIIFNSEMIRAILGGRKTQTRRPIKPQPVYKFKHLEEGLGYKASEGNLYAGFYEEGTSGMYVKCPYGKVGDRLWVRETFCEVSLGAELRYKATDKKPAIQNWKPSIHMPRWASRITLEITDVRVERLKEIKPDDCLKEGIIVDRKLDKMFSKKEINESTILCFWGLWHLIYGKTEYNWDINPWVWVIEFKRLDK